MTCDYQFSLYSQKGNATEHKAWIPNRTIHLSNRFRVSLVCLKATPRQSCLPRFCEDQFSHSYLHSCYPLQSRQKYLQKEHQLLLLWLFPISILPPNQCRVLPSHLQFSKWATEYPRNGNGISSNR